jgi:RNA-directed DNA polymerase
MMYEPEKSDSAIVAMKLANKTAVSKAVAELVEPRAGTKGNTEQSHTRRTQCRGSVSQRLNRVRKAARQRKKESSQRYCTILTWIYYWSRFWRSNAGLLPG